MRLKWYGTASLLIEGGDTRILIDPYLKQYNPALPRLPIEEAAAADAAVITHPHVDHFGDIGTFLEAGLKEVYVSKTGIRRAQKDGLDTGRMVCLEPNQVVTIGELTVTAYPSRHCVFDAGIVLGLLFSPHAWAHFATAMKILGGALHYHIRRSDVLALEIAHRGRRVMVLGSAGLDPDTDYPTGADLLVFAYQGHSNMSEYMKPFLQILRPKAVMPSHFDDAFPPISSAVSTDGFVSAVQEVLPHAEAFVPTEGQWYEV